MKINKDNYEAFLVDYWENKLDERQHAELELFLDDHPEIRQEMEGAMSVVLPKEPVVFHDKDCLHSSKINQNELSEAEMLLIAELESELTEAQAIRLAELKKSDSKLVEQARLFALTKLKPDFAIRYPNKSQIRKKTTPIIPMWVYSSAAAVLIVAVAIFSLMSPTDNNNFSQTAYNGNKKTEQPSLLPTGADSKITGPKMQHSETSNDITASVEHNKGSENFDKKFQEFVANTEEVPQIASTMEFRPIVFMPSLKAKKAPQLAPVGKQNLSQELLLQNNRFIAAYKEAVNLSGNKK